MLKTRLIPTLLLKAGRCIKTKQFANERDTGDPVTAAKVYDAQGADELIFLDITASHEKRDILFNVVNKVAEECFMPLTVGGGIRSVEDIRTLLKMGADKVAICSAFIENPDFINEAAQLFGSSTIIGVISYRYVDGKPIAFTHGKTQNSQLEVMAWAKEMVRRGVGELLLYSIDRDGMMEGYDMELLEHVAKNVSCPVIACGGVGSLDDFVQIFKKTKVSAVSAGSIFHFTDQNLIKTRAHMKNCHLNVRTV